MGAIHYTQEEKDWMLKFAEEHRQFKTDLIIRKLLDEYCKQPRFTKRTDRGLLTQYERACRDIKRKEERELQQAKVEEEQTEKQRSTNGIQKELPLTTYSDDLLYQDVSAMVNGSITAMRRAEVIAGTIKTPTLRIMAKDLIDSFWK